MFCSKCGNKIEDSAKFCDNCGNAIAVEQLGTNTSAKVSTKKANKKLPVILGVCVVVIILIAISISVLGKKADKVTKIVKAYENTINAENFDIYLGVAERHWCMEVFGKESFEDTYIATFFNNDLGYESDNWLKYINGEDLYRLIHDEYYVDKGRDTLKNNASDWFAYDEYEMIAKRDFEALWNHEFSDEIGLTYDEAYDLATSIVLNYLKNKNDSAVESIEIEDNKYSIRCGVDNFAEDSEYEDTVNEFIDYIEDAYIYAYDCDEGCKLEEIYFEVKLEGKYIKSLSIYLTFDTEINGKDEIPFFILQFANVNELTKETSLAYKLYDELSEDAE